MIKKLMKGGALLDLRITTNTKLVRNVKAGNSLGPREMIEFIILGCGNKAKEGFRTAVFQGSLSPNLLIVHTNIWEISKGDRRSVWMNTDSLLHVLTILRHKEEAYEKRKHSQVIQEE